MDPVPSTVDENLPILKKSKSTTGVSDLDLILEGGYSNPGLVMLIGPTGMEKMVFAFHFAAEGVKKGEKVFYINSDATPQDLLSKASNYGLELENDKSFKFIDCYSSTLGMKNPSNNSFFVPGLAALNDLSLSINEAMKESAGTRMRVIFHSLSALVLYNPRESILKFIQVVGGRLKATGATVLFLLEDGVHEKQLLTTIESTMDEKFTIHDKGGSFTLEINSISTEIPIKLTPTGINII